MSLRRALAAGAVAAVFIAPTAASAHEDPTSTPHVDTEQTGTITDLLRTAMRYEQTKQKVAALQAEATEATARAAAAEAAAQKQAALVVHYLTSLEQQPAAQRLRAFTTATSPQDLIDTIYSTQQIEDLQAVRISEAEKAHDAAEKADAEAATATAEADAANERAEALVTAMSKQAEALDIGASNIDPTLPGTAADKTARNEKATAAWTEYRQSLDGIALPTARDLRNPDKRLPAGLQKVTAGGKTVRGVAQVTRLGEPITVLPRETIRTIDQTLATLGSLYTAKGNGGRDFYTCTTLITDHGDVSGKTPADLYERTRKVPASSRQPGDLIFLATPESGIHHVGLYIGDGMMIDAAATRYTVDATPVPEDVYAVTRPALGRGHNTAPKATKAKNPPTTCNATRPKQTAPKGLRMPMKDGSYRLTAHFGQAGGLWSSGHHTGQDFAAPTGTPIYAAHTGTVTITPVSWAGNLITVTREDGTEDRYAHTSRQFVKTGDKVQVGQKIADVGAEGNVTGPHLHFEIKQDGGLIDPMPLLLDFLPNRSAADSWGGYANGQIPAAVLCETGQVTLRCDAAAAFTDLAAAYQREQGGSLPVAVSYESLAQQVHVDAETGNLDQYPGTSPYGWALQVGLDDLDSVTSAWLDEHGPEYGWTRNGADLTYGQQQ